MSATFEGTLLGIPSVAFSQEVARGLLLRARRRVRPPAGRRAARGERAAARTCCSTSTSRPASIARRSLHPPRPARLPAVGGREGGPAGPQVLLDRRHAGVADGRSGTDHEAVAAGTRLGDAAAPRPHRLPRPRDLRRSRRAAGELRPPRRRRVMAAQKPTRTTLRRASGWCASCSPPAASRPAGARRDARGAAPPLRPRASAQPGLRRPRAADRRRADHLAALRGGADDASCWRSSPATRCSRSAPAPATRPRSSRCLARWVYSLERIPELAHQAIQRMRELGHRSTSRSRPSTARWAGARWRPSTASW